MLKRSQFLKPIALSKLDGVAIALAVLLSFLCLARGAVYDSVVAIALLYCLPLLFVVLSSGRVVHGVLQRTGLLFLACFAAVLCLQQLLPASGHAADLWQQVEGVLSRDIREPMLTDKAAWLQGGARFMLFMMVFILALFIGSSEFSSRVFLFALLISGTLCLSFTFFLGGHDEGSTAYRHGFVNTNNAAAYLGIMLLLALMHVVRFLKLPAKADRRFILDLVDRLNVLTAVKGGFLLFSALLALGGLFMTGSRGGILVSLICISVFCLLNLLKANLRSALRQLILIVAVGIMGTLLVWSFINYGKPIVHKLTIDGISSNTRPDIIAATAPMIEDHALLGTGLGSFPHAFQRYRPQNLSTDGIIDKAHNSYVEFAAEMGVPMFVVLMLALGRLGFLLVSGVRGRRERYVVPAFGLSVWLLAALHSLMDFPLQIPGIAALCIAITVICASQADPRFSQPAQANLKKERRRIRVRRRAIKPI